ncbi:MAG: autotransporter-associated beta strand repeat-containing protein, partial [Rubripirellula sp.]
MPDESYVRLGQKYFENWRDSDFNTATPDGNNPTALSNTTFVNNTNQKLVIGVNAEGNLGSSKAPVISNGKANFYDGVSLVPSGTRLELLHEKGLGNNGSEIGAEYDNNGNVIYTGTATAATYDDNGTIVEDGATLELLPGIWLNKERVTLSGDGVDGLGAVYSEGSSSQHTRLNGDTVILDGNASIGVEGAGYIVLSDSINGTGDFTKLGTGALSFGKPGSLNGNFFVEAGTLEGRSNVVRGDLVIDAGAAIAAYGSNMVNAPANHAEINGVWNLNARGDDTVLSHQIGSISGVGTIISNDPTDNPGGTVQLKGDSGSADYAGSITGLVNIEKTGTNTQVFSGSLTHSGTTTVSAGTLLIEGTHTGGGTYTVHSNATLGGSGSIGSAVIVNSAGHLAPGASSGTLSANSVTLSSGSFFDVEIGGTSAGSGYDQVLTNSATLGGTLSVSLIGSGGTVFAPAPADTFSIAVSSGSLSGAFDNVASGQRVTTTGGEGTFLVTYDASSKTVVLSDYAVVAVPASVVGRGV